MILSTYFNCNTKLRQKVGAKNIGCFFPRIKWNNWNKIPVWAGVADSLYLGDILIKNAVFQVLPDEQLHFPSLNYTLDGILGFPVITQLKEVHIRRNGDFVISPNPTHSNLNNLAFDGSTTVISVKNDSDTLSFHFDSGATASEFYSNYFNRYKTEIQKKAKLKQSKVGVLVGP
ncbi:hypothetical protein PEC18_34120 [Paucibacter sp. O1-1]|nr:hypothetical protein [Paucibacter sp. O1-1]MDA3830728.1 hypothetical protein [Paucibacter sp. O1-1]